MKRKILAIGEIIWDVYSDKKAIGGAALNFVAHAAICGATGALISAVGNDDLASDALKAVEEFYVDTRYIKKTDLPTGQCLVTLDERSVPCYNVLEDVAYDNIVLDQEELDGINSEKYDALYFGTLIQRNAVSRAAVSAVLENCKFENIICDVNLRPNCYDNDSVERCLTHATILKISIEEEPALRATGLYAPDGNELVAIAKAICQKFKQIKILIITLGKDGSYLYSAENDKEYRQASIGDKVVSTVGAGDSFAASWLTMYLNGNTIEDCLKTASEVSGFVVANLGAVPKYSIQNGKLHSETSV